MAVQIKITKEMFNRAERESKKRDPDINHHFEVSHFTPLERDMIGFVGEFAACELLNIEWKDNIRSDYKTIDEQDIIYYNQKIDVKTETVPQYVLNKIVTRTIGDDEVYGRRLINEGQIPLLRKYEIVIFGVIERDKKDYWYPIGWLTTKEILAEYKSTKNRPDGGQYPFAGLPVKTSHLKSMDELKDFIKKDEE
jgi:hypothetical protein